MEGKCSMRGNDEAMIVATERMAKAENDLKAAAYLVRMADCPTDTVCFHAQQCVEKCLKALLVTQGTDFRKTHDLGELMILLPSGLRPSIINEEQDKLTEYATVTRYPGNYDPITLGEARQAVKIARRVRREVGRLLSEKPPFAGGQP